MRPDFPDIIYRQASCALSLGDTLRAGGFIKKYLSIYKEQSGYTESQLKSVLGNLYSDAGILNKAEQYFRQALNLNPENHFRLSDLAGFLIKENINVEEGMELVNRALELSPDNYNYQYTKGLGLLKKGNYTEALDLLEKSWIQRSDYNHDHYLTIQATKKAVAEPK